jgi:anti-sigma factor RsiW
MNTFNFRDTCEHHTDVERWFDGESARASFVEGHLETCAACAKHLKFLESSREAVGAVVQHAEISDSQFAAFMGGIHQETSQRPRNHRGLWTLASLVSAALLIALSIFTVLAPGNTPAIAVDNYETGIEGASIELLYSDDDTPTVWVNMPDGGMM